MRYDPKNGTRLTDCCGAYSTYCETTLACKKCWNEVPVGQGDGVEKDPNHRSAAFCLRMPRNTESHGGDNV